MAKVKLNTCRHLTDTEKQKFREDDLTGEIFVAVTDEDSQLLLQQILSALGGSSDTTTAVSNIIITTANAEQAIPLPANVKTFLIRSRNKGKMKLAYASGGTTGSEYLTVPAGSSYKDSQFYSNQTIYVASNKAGDVIEIVTHV